MAKNDHFIQAALNPKHKGDLSGAAKKAGMSTIEFARAHQHDKGLQGNQARFFLNVLNRVRPPSKKHGHHARGDNEKMETTPDSEKGGG